VGWYKNEEGTWKENERLGTYRMVLLRSQPGWRIAGEFSKAVTDQFLTGAVELGAGAQATAGEHFFAQVTGTKPYSKDVDRWKEWAWRGAERRLIAEMRNANLTVEAEFVSKISADDFTIEELLLLKEHGSLEQEE